MSRVRETCSVPITEPCPFHPIDCTGCVNDKVCQMRKDMKAYPDKIKRCRFFRPKLGRPL